MKIITLIAMAVSVLLYAQVVLAVEESDAIIVSTYENWAWGYQYSQTIVDEDGNIYTKGLKKPFEKEKSDYKFVRTIDKKTLEEIKKLIEQASRGKISEGLHSAYDAGKSTLKCYYNDPNTGNREEVFLQMEGDFTSENMSDAAKQLTDMIMNELSPHDK